MSACARLRSKLLDNLSTYLFDVEFQDEGSVLHEAPLVQVLAEKEKYFKGRAGNAANSVATPRPKPKGKAKGKAKAKTAGKPETDPKLPETDDDKLKKELQALGVTVPSDVDSHEGDENDEFVE